MKTKGMKGPMAAWLDTSGPAPYKKPPKRILNEAEVLRLINAVRKEPCNGRQKRSQKNLENKTSG